MHEADDPPVLAAHLYEGSFCGADRGVSGLARHGGLGQEPWPEVFHGDGVVVAHNLLGPLTGRVLPLSGDLLACLRAQPLRLTKALRGRFALGRFAAGHHPVVPGQLFSGLLAVFGVWEVVAVAGGGRSFLDTPVHTNHRAGFGELLDFGGNNERGVPMAYAIAVNAHTGRRSGQLSRPHQGQDDAAREVQAVVLEPEAAPCVIERRVGLVLFLVSRHTGPLALRQTVLDVLQCLGAGLAEVANELLLRDRAALGQPRRGGAGFGQHLVQPGRPALFPVAMGLLRAGNAFVPDPPTAVPLAEQCRVGGRRQAKPIGVPSMPGALGRLWCRNDTKLPLRFEAWITKYESHSGSPVTFTPGWPLRPSRPAGPSTPRLCTAWRTSAPLRRQTTRRPRDVPFAALLRRSLILPRPEGRTLGGFR